MALGSSLLAIGTFSRFSGHLLFLRPYLSVLSQTTPGGRPFFLF